MVRTRLSVTTSQSQVDSACKADHSLVKIAQLGRIDWAGRVGSGCHELLETLT